MLAIFIKNDYVGVKELKKKKNAILHNIICTTYTYIKGLN